MQTMESFKQTVESLVATPEERWMRGNASMETHEINGHEMEVAIFDSKVQSIDLLSQRDIEIRETVEGQVSHYEVVTDNGYLRHVKVYEPSRAGIENARVTIHMDSAWFTGESGHNDRIATKMMKGTGQPVVLVGPEEFPQHDGALFVARNLGKIATDSEGVSLSRSAEDSVEILATVMELHPGLSRDVVVVGESRGAMLAPAKDIPAAKRDISNIYYDLTDPCIPDGILSSPKYMYLLPLFLTNEVAHGLPVAANLALRHELLCKASTIPLRARYLGAAVLGTGPALLNGEAGKLPALLPSDRPVHTTNFKSNPIAGYEIWRERYAHTRYAGVHLKGAHLGLAYSSVSEHVIQRINDLVDEMRSVVDVDYRKVHLKDDQRYLNRLEQSPAA